MGNPITYERKNDNQTEIQCSYCGKTLFTTIYREFKNMFCNNNCKGNFLRGENNFNYKHGNGYIRKDGRVKVYAPKHPNAPSDGLMYRYRLVAEEMLGRYLEPNETVHHKDLDPTNDDPSNLQVMTKSEHQKLHAQLRKKAKQGNVVQLSATISISVEVAA